jgi:small subunit ribosomal protein S5e
MCTGARKSAMKTIKSISECLADEIIACAAEDMASFAIKKKMDIEKNAKANR